MRDADVGGQWAWSSHSRSLRRWSSTALREGLGNLRAVRPRLRRARRYCAVRRSVSPRAPLLRHSRSRHPPDWRTTSGSRHLHDRRLGWRCASLPGPAGRSEQATTRRAAHRLGGQRVFGISLRAAMRAERGRPSSGRTPSRARASGSASCSSSRTHRTDRPASSRSERSDDSLESRNFGSGWRS